jgi:hypothetical protein
MEGLTAALKKVDKSIHITISEMVLRKAQGMSNIPARDCANK